MVGVTGFDAPAGVRYQLVPPDGVERTALSDGGTIDFSPLRNEKSAGLNLTSIINRSPYARQGE